MAVDAIEKLLDVDLDDRCLVAPFHAGDPHVVLHVERRPDGALAVHTGEGTVNEDGAEKVLELLMDDKLHDLIPKVRYVEAPGLRLRDRPVTVRAGTVLTPPRLRSALNFLEIRPELDVVHLREKVIAYGLTGKLPVTSEGLFIARLDHRPPHHILVLGGRHRRRDELTFGVLGVVVQNGEFRHLWHPFQLERLGTYDAGLYPHCRQPPAAQYDRVGGPLSLFLRRLKTWRRITSPLKYNKDSPAKP